MYFPSHRDVLAVTQDTNHKKYPKDPCKTQNHHSASYIHTDILLCVFIQLTHNKSNTYIRTYSSCLHNTEIELLTYIPYIYIL